MADPASRPGIAPCLGLGRLAPNFDLLLCDVFGTLHDAAGPFPEAIAALSRFRLGGGTVVLLSNAAAPGPVLAASLAARGIGPEIADAVVSAADVTRGLIAERGARRILHLGPDEDRVLFDGLTLDLCGVGEAEIVVCTGYPETDPAPALDRARACGLDLVCTNPDRQIRIGPRLLRFAGLVAEGYAARGGRVIATGKPDPSIYALALARAAAVTGRRFSPPRIIAAGDTEALDVAGALAQGFAAIHLTATAAAAAPARLHRMPALVW